MKPTILLVHGAYHQPAHFAKLADHLEEMGYETEGVALPSVGADADPGNALSQDAAAIKEGLVNLTQQGKNVVLFMHSYGGITQNCGSEAAASFLEQRKPQADEGTATIVRLIYVNAYALNKGDSWAAEHTAGKDPNAANFPASVDDKGIATWLKPVEYYYTPTTDAAEAEAAVALLRPMATSAFLEPTQYGAYAWAEYGVPVSYVGCKLDRMLPISMQEDFVKRMREAMVSVTATWLQYDHSPFLSHAEELAKIVDVAVEKGE